MSHTECCGRISNLRREKIALESHCRHKGKKATRRYGGNQSGEGVKWHWAEYRLKGKVLPGASEPLSEGDCGICWVPYTITLPPSQSSIDDISVEYFIGYPVAHPIPLIKEAYDAETSTRLAAGYNKSGLRRNWERRVSRGVRRSHLSTSTSPQWLFISLMFVAFFRTERRDLSLGYPLHRDLCNFYYFTHNAPSDHGGTLLSRFNSEWPEFRVVRMVRSIT